MSKALAFSLAMLIVAAPLIGAQGDRLVALRDSIEKLRGHPGFASAWRTGLSSIASLEEAVWLLDAIGAASSGIEARQILVERARLLQLAGRFREAAADWERASASGSAEPAYLAQAAACRLATGDGPGALRLASSIADTWPGTSWESLAVVMKAWADTQSGNSIGAEARVAPLTDHPDDRVSMCASLFLIHMSSAGAGASASESLAKRFPSLAQSIEAGQAQLALSAALEALSTRALEAGRQESAETAADHATGKKVAGASGDEAAIPAVGSPTVPSESKAPPSGRSGVQETVFQIGAFRDEANAQSAAARLRLRGLSPTVSFKKERSLYIVYVDGGIDPNKTVIAIKDAGFEAFRMESRP